MAAKVIDIEGIGPVMAGKLEAVGIRSVDDLLGRCAAAKGRGEVAEATGISAQKLLDWVNMADLMRLTGVGPEFAELLEAAGVDTVKELQHRRADNLQEKLAEVNAARKLCRRTPAATEVGRWIEEAKTLPPLVSH